MPFITCNTFRAIGGGSQTLYMHGKDSTKINNRNRACPSTKCKLDDKITNFPQNHPHYNKKSDIEAQLRAPNKKSGKKSFLGASCEEYPWASTTTGGQRGNSRCIPWYENLMQAIRINLVLIGADASKCQAYYDIMDAATN